MLPPVHLFFSLLTVLLVLGAHSNPEGVTIPSFLAPYCAPWHGGGWEQPWLMFRGRVILSTWLLRSSPCHEEAQRPLRYRHVLFPAYSLSAMSQSGSGPALGHPVGSFVVDQDSLCKLPSWEVNSQVRCSELCPRWGSPLTTSPSEPLLSEATVLQKSDGRQHTFHASWSVSLAQVLSLFSVWPKLVPKSPLCESRAALGCKKVHGWESRPPSRVIHLRVPEFHGLAPGRMPSALEQVTAVLHFPCQPLWSTSIINFINCRNMEQMPNIYASSLCKRKCLD